MSGTCDAVSHSMALIRTLDAAGKQRDLKELLCCCRRWRSRTWTSRCWSLLLCPRTGCQPVPRRSLLPPSLLRRLCQRGQQLRSQPKPRKNWSWSSLRQKWQHDCCALRPSWPHACARLHPTRSCTYCSSTCTQKPSGLWRPACSVYASAPHEFDRRCLFSIVRWSPLLLAVMKRIYKGGGGAKGRDHRKK